MDHAGVLVQEVCILMICDDCRENVSKDQKFVTLAAEGKPPLFFHLECVPFNLRNWVKQGRKMGDSTMMPKGWEPGT